MLKNAMSRKMEYGFISSFGKILDFFFAICYMLEHFWHNFGGYGGFKQC